MTEFARPFRVNNVGGRMFEGKVIHGTQFPDGRCVIALPWGGFHVAIDFEHLELEPGAVVEWCDGGRP